MFHLFYARLASIFYASNILHICKRPIGSPVLWTRKYPSSDFISLFYFYKSANCVIIIFTRHAKIHDTYVNKYRVSQRNVSKALNGYNLCHMCSSITSTISALAPKEVPPIALQTDNICTS